VDRKGSTRLQVVDRLQQKKGPFTNCGKSTPILLAGEKEPAKREKTPTAYQKRHKRGSLAPWKERRGGAWDQPPFSM